MHKIKTTGTALLVAVGLLLTGCAGSESGKDLAGNAVKADSGAPKASEKESAPEETTEAPKGPKALAIGSPATITQDEKDAARVTIGKPTRKAKDPSDFGDKSKNGNFLIFPIVVKAIGSDTFDINPFDFYVRDAEGNKFDYGDGAMYLSADNTLNATTLNPGEQVKGVLVFDAGKATNEVVYAPMGQSLGFWKF